MLTEHPTVIAMTTLAWRDVRPGRRAGRLGERWPGHPERPGQLPGRARTGAQASGELDLRRRSGTDD
jgi:hypothetical protein